MGRFAAEPITMNELVLILDGVPDKTNPHKHNSYINHSKNGNLTLIEGFKFMANRHINIGEELTWNYNEMFTVPKEWDLDKFD